MPYVSVNPEKELLQTKLKELADYSLHVPIKSMQITEDVHMIFDHLMMSVFYKTMCGINHIKEQADE